MNYILFAGNDYDCKFGAFASLGVFESLDAAKSFFENGVVRDTCDKEVTPAETFYFGQIATVKDNRLVICSQYSEGIWKDVSDTKFEQLYVFYAGQ